MTKKKAGTKRLPLKKAEAGKKATARRETTGDPPVLRLPLVGKIKRADIRKAVREVREEKARARAAAGEA